MGQGSSEKAIRALKKAASEGGWLVLQNMHLVVDWVTLLEVELSHLENRHAQFRLWITTEAHSRYSTSFLKSCQKITLESPPGNYQFCN